MANRPKDSVSFIILVLAFIFCGSALYSMPTVPDGDVSMKTQDHDNPYVNRRKRLADRIKSGVALLMAGKAGEDVPFFPDANFYYLTGLETPEAVLVLWPDAPREEWKEVLFLPPADPVYERWNGPRLHPESEEVKNLGFHSVMSLTQFNSMLGRFLRQTETLWMVAESRNLGDPPSDYLSLIQRIRDEYPYLAIRSLNRELDDLRRVKDESEIEKIKKAIAITGSAFQRIFQELRPGKFEYEIQGLVEYEFRRHGARFNAFPSIIGAGVRSTILHYNRNDGKIKKGDLVVIDIGARYDGYCADITRTLPASGRFTEEQARYYRIVLEAQQEAIKAVRPGVIIRDVVHKAVLEVFKKYEVEQYFPHGTSHYLGLDVHDVGDYRKPLEPGVVITVEPGLYIPEKGIGIRIEDDVLVTENGAIVLSEAIPRTIEAIEKAMRRRRASH